MSAIPDDIRRYVLQCIPSVPYMEAALLMRENHAQSWRPDRLARRLYLPDEEGLKLLARMRKDGIVELVNGETTEFQFAPKSAELRELWERLAALYAHHLIEVTAIIHSRTDDKANMLAAAFVWRKEK